MNLSKEYINDIKRASENNTLAVFIGAGISKTSDTKINKLPLWSDVIEDLRAQLGDCEETDFLKIAELYFLKYKKAVYCRKIEKLFNFDVMPSKIHKLILELNPSVIITTNWDDLIEKAINENGYFYDTISCDEDLGKSTLPKKLIKMHGDFAHHNFVFKESDYINYSDNFPLIENYVKSILSSNTVLFLGYSFNDFNLKQILGWITRRTSIVPSLYIVSNNTNEWATKYLESQRLIPLFLDNNMIDLFLRSAKNGIEEYSLPESYILSKIEHLSPLRHIHYRSIESAFKYSRIRVFKECVLLQLPNSGDSANSNIEKFRLKCESLAEMLPNKISYSEDMKKALSILSKAGIDGIICKIDSSNVKYFRIPEEFRPNVDWIQNCMDFKICSDSCVEENDEIQPLKMALSEYNLQNYGKSYDILIQNVESFQRTRNFFWTFILMSNINNLNLFIKIRNLSDGAKYEKYNLEEKFNNLSYDWKKQIKPIYELSNFAMYYKETVDTLKLFLDKEYAAETIKNGRSFYQSDPETYRFYHKSLLEFVIDNFIMVEEYMEFTLMIELFLRITVCRSVTDKKIKFNKYELYSVIKYLQPQKTTYLLKNCILSKEDNEHRIFESESVETKKWLINVFKNLCETYRKQTYCTKNNIEKFLRNTLFLLSLLKLEQEEVLEIDSCIKILVKGDVTLNVIEGISSFVANLANVNSICYPRANLLSILNTFLLKFTTGNINFQEFYALQNNYFCNVINCIQGSNNTKFKDVSLVDNVIIKYNQLDDEKPSAKYSLILNLFFPLYSISDKKVKDRIKDFIKKLTLNDEYTEILCALNQMLLFYSPSKIRPKDVSTLIERTKNFIAKEKSTRLVDIGRAFLYLKRKLSANISISVQIEDLVREIKKSLNEFRFPSQI